MGGGRGGPKVIRATARGGNFFWPCGLSLTRSSPAANLSRPFVVLARPGRQPGNGAFSMNGRDSIQSLLVLRKLTRAIADVVRAQMTEYLSTVTPLVKPSALLGDYIQGGSKENTRKAEKVFKEIHALYEGIAPTKPFSLPRDLTPPLNFPATTLEITPVEYQHAAETGSGPRTITVRCPLSWVLTYSGFAPSRAQELMGSNTQLRATADLQKFVLAQVML